MPARDDVPMPGRADTSNLLRLTTLAGTPCDFGNQQPIRAYCPVDSEPRFYIVKQHPVDNVGRAFDYEEYRYDDQYIYLIQDTSWQEAEWCTERGTAYQTSFELWEVDRSAGISSLGGKHFPRCVEVGETYMFGDQYLVSRYENQDENRAAPENLRCQICRQARASSRSFRVTEHKDSHTFQLGGEPVEDVLVIDALTNGNQIFERYYFSRAHGWVGYEDIVNGNNPNLQDNCVAKLKAGFSEVANPYEIRARKSCPWLDLDPSPRADSEIVTCDGSAFEASWILDVRTGIEGRRNTFVNEVMIFSDVQEHTWSLTCDDTAGKLEVDGDVGKGEFSLLMSPLTSPTPPRWLSGEIEINGERILNLWSEPNQPPPLVQNLQVVIDELTVTVTASWDGVTDPEGEEVNYWVIISSESTIVEEILTGETTIEILSLLPDQTYQLEVRALDPWDHYFEPVPESFFLGADMEAGLTVRLFDTNDPVGAVSTGFTGLQAGAFEIRTSSSVEVVQSVLVPVVNFADTNFDTVAFYNLGPNGVIDPGSNATVPQGDDISIAPPGGNDTFGAQFSGFVYLPEGGNVTFTVGIDDAFDLIVNGESVAQFFGITNFRNVSGTAQNLPVGLVPITLNYGQGPGEANVVLRAVGGGLPGGVIPPEFLFTLAP